MEGCGTGNLNMLTNCRNKTINELDIWQGWSEKKVLNFNGLKLESFGILKHILWGKLVKK